YSMPLALERRWFVVGAGLSAAADDLDLLSQDLHWPAREPTAVTYRRASLIFTRCSTSRQIHHAVITIASATANSVKESPKPITATMPTRIQKAAAIV